MKRLLLSLVAVATALTAFGSAEAQRWHGRDGYHHRGGYGGYHRAYYGNRYYGHRRGYWHHGRRYHR